METKKTHISITLIPDENTCSEALLLHDKIADKFEVKDFTENERQNYIHISMYNATFPEHNKNFIEDILKDISEKYKPVDFIPNGRSIKSTYVAVTFQKTHALENLHNEIIERLNHLREGLIQSKYIQKTELYSKEELENAHKYGYSFCKELFVPHMTIAQLENQNDVTEAVNEIDWKKSFTSNTLSLKIIFTNEKDERVSQIKLFTLHSASCSNNI